jgi:hypothetical protein
MCVECDLSLDRCKVVASCEKCFAIIVAKVERVEGRGDTPGVRLLMQVHHRPCPGGECVEWKPLPNHWAPRTHHAHPMQMKVAILAVLLCMVRRNNTRHLVLPPEVVIAHILPPLMMRTPPPEPPTEPLPSWIW